MTSERLTTRAFAPSVAIGPRAPVGVEAGLGEGALALDETLLGLRAAEEVAVLRRFRLLTLALLYFSRLAQIDNLSQKRPASGYFLRKASIDTTFASPAASAGFSAR